MTITQLLSVLLARWKFILIETLTELDPQYPESDLDVPALMERLASTE